MGCNSSVNNEEAQKSSQLNKDLQEAKLKDDKFKKLLLLGPGQSGKSTFFKQIKNLYSSPWNQDQLLRFLPLIQSNMLLNMRTLIKAVLQSQQQSSQQHHRYLLKQGKEDPNCPTNCYFAPEVADSAAAIMEIDDDSLSSSKPGSKFSPEIVKALKALWSDPAIQKIWSYRNRYQIDDSSSYFFGNIDKIAAPDYIPNQSDVFHLRIITTGINEMKFEVGNVQFLLVDVGGQRNERKKWIHCFSGVSAVLFVVAVNEYDQALFEEGNMNRMRESLNLWEDISNSSYFVHTSLILFLNKCDLLTEKLKKTPLKVFFTNYAGNNSFDDAVSYISAQFLGLVHDHERIVYVHTMTAIVTDNIKEIFADIRLSVLCKNICDVGMI